MVEQAGPKIFEQSSRRILKIDDKLKSFICLGNDLVESSHRLTALEQHIVIYVMGALRKADTYLRVYRIRLGDIANLLGLSTSSGYTRIIKAIIQLASKKVIIDKEDSIVVTTWFDFTECLKSVEANSGGWVDVKFSDKLEPYLLDLEGNFTELQNKSLFTLSGRYSIQFYLWVKRWWYIGTFMKMREISVHDLRILLALNQNTSLDIDKDMYVGFDNFRRRVLQPLIKDINSKSDIYVSCKTKKVGKSIKNLQFYFSRTNHFRNIGEFEDAVERRRGVLKVEDDSKTFLEDPLGLTTDQKLKKIAQKHKVGL